MESPSHPALRRGQARFPLYPLPRPRDSGRITTMKEKSDKVYFMFGRVGEVFSFFSRKKLVPGGWTGLGTNGKQEVYQARTKKTGNDLLLIVRLFSTFDLR